MSDATWTDWAKRNKAGIGLVVGGLGLYVKLSCPGLEAHCSNIGLILTHIGTFLTGSGILDSDTREKYIQGILPAKPADNKE